MRPLPAASRGTDIPAGEALERTTPRPRAPRAVRIVERGGAR